MMPWRYKRIKIIEIDKDFDIEAKEIISNLSLHLSEQNYRTNINLNNLFFHKSIETTTHSGLNRIRAMKVLRNGEIKLSKLDKNQLKIACIVDLDSLIFMSVLLGLSIGIFCRTISYSSYSISILYGVIISIIIYFIGCLNIKGKLDELIIKSCNI